MTRRFTETNWNASAPKDGRPTVALIPAGGELWEDFLDTIGVELSDFCAEGPGGWMLGYLQALNHVGVRTLLLFVSARFDGPKRYRDPQIGNEIVVLPTPTLYRCLRNQLPTYRNLMMVGAGHGAVKRAAAVAGSAWSYFSTPMSSIEAEFRRQEVEAILCQEYEYFRFNQMCALGRRMKVPVFASFQGADKDHNLLARRRKLHSIQDAAALFIGPSGEAARVASAYNVKPKIRRVFNPVDLESWHSGGRDEGRRKLGIRERDRVAVWHGRVSIHAKGLDILAAAWAQVCAANQRLDHKLLLIGAGEDSSALTELFASSPKHSVLRVDRYTTSRSEIRDLLAVADVYAFPSRHEGFAVAPIEAMACGLPIVAADASGVHDMLDGSGAGVVVPRGEVAPFAQALGRLLASPSDAARMGLAARRRAEQAFSLEAVGRQLGDAMFGPSGSRQHRG